MLTHQGNIYWQGPKSDSAGRPLVHSARKTLSLLKARMKSQRQNHGAVRLVLPDGSQMVAAIQNYGNVPIYRIYVDPAPRGPRIIPISGLFEGRTADPVGDGTFSSVVLVSVASPGVYTRTPFETNAEVLNSLMFNEPMLSPCTQMPLGWRGPESAYSGMWTGEMSKVVQWLFGAGVTVPYAHCATRTHGIWVGANGSRWVIEIDTTTGITAWELARIGSTVPRALGYAPVPVATLPNIVDRIQLADASALSDYDGYRKLSNLIGWAFDSNGHNATTVAFEYDSPTKVYKGHLLDVTITGGDSPNSATVTTTESDWVYTPNHSVQGIKHMYVWGGDGPWFRSFYQSIQGSTSPGECHGPVYSFYEGNDKVVIRQNYTPAVTQAIDTRPAGDRLYGCSTRTSVNYGVTSEDTSYRFGTDAWDARFWYSVDGGAYTRDLPVPPSTKVSQAAEVSGTWKVIGDWVGANDDGVIGMGETHLVLTDSLKIYDHISTGYLIETLIIPFLSRTSFYIWQSRGSTDEAQSHRMEWEAPYWKGDFYQDYGYSEAYYSSSQGNPCGCGEPYPEYIGRWTEDAAPSGHRDTPWIVWFGGVPLLPPKPDDNHPGLMVFCYDSATRYGYVPDPNNPCKQIGTFGSCGAPVEDTDVVIAEEQAGYHRCNFYYRGVTHEVVNSQGYHEFFSETTAWWHQILDKPSEDGYQRLFVNADAFTGAGWASGDIYNYADASTFIVFKNADSYYPMNETRFMQQGFFGVPFPELLPL